MASPHRVSGLSLYSPGSWKWLAVVHEAAWDAEWGPELPQCALGLGDPQAPLHLPLPRTARRPLIIRASPPFGSNCISFSREHALSTYPSKDVSDAGEQSRFPLPGSWLNQDRPGRGLTAVYRNTPWSDVFKSCCKTMYCGPVCSVTMGNAFIHRTFLEWCVKLVIMGLGGGHIGFFCVCPFLLFEFFTEPKLYDNF